MEFLGPWGLPQRFLLRRLTMRTGLRTGGYWLSPEQMASCGRRKANSNSQMAKTVRWDGTPTETSYRPCAPLAAFCRFAKDMWWLKIRALWRMSGPIIAHNVWYAYQWPCILLSAVAWIIDLGTRSSCCREMPNTLCIHADKTSQTSLACDGAASANYYSVYTIKYPISQSTFPGLLWMSGFLTAWAPIYCSNLRSYTFRIRSG